MLDAFHSNEDHGYVKALSERRGLSHRVGEQFACLHQASAIKKEFHLEVNKIVIIKLKWNMLKAKV